MVSGVCEVAPSTPNPPARLTAATTSRQWLKANSGNSIPSISQTGDFMIRVPFAYLFGRHGLRRVQRHLFGPLVVGLAVGGALNGVDADDLARGLVAGDARAAELDQGPLVDLPARLGRQHSRHALAEPLVR